MVIEFSFIARSRPSQPQISQEVFSLALFSPGLVSPALFSPEPGSLRHTLLLTLYVTYRQDSPLPRLESVKFSNPVFQSQAVSGSHSTAKAADREDACVKTKGLSFERPWSEFKVGQTRSFLRTRNRVPWITVSVYGLGTAASACRDVPARKKL